MRVCSSFYSNRKVLNKKWPLLHSRIVLAANVTQILHKKKVCFRCKNVDVFYLFWCSGTKVGFRKLWVNKRFIFNSLSVLSKSIYTLTKDVGRSQRTLQPFSYVTRHVRSSFFVHVCYPNLNSAILWYTFNMLMMSLDEFIFNRKDNRQRPKRTESLPLTFNATLNNKDTGKKGVSIKHHKNIE